MARSNSVYPQGEAQQATNSGGMAESGAGAEAAAAAVAAEMGAAEAAAAEQMEMGRLQAMLEARGLPSHILGALGPRIGGLLGRGNNHPSGMLAPSWATYTETCSPVE